METLTKIYYQPDSIRTDHKQEGPGGTRNRVYTPRVLVHTISIWEFDNPHADAEMGELLHGFAAHDDRSGWTCQHETLDSVLEHVQRKANFEGWMTSRQEAETESARIATRRSSAVVARLRKLPHAGGHKLLGCDIGTFQGYIAGVEDVPPQIVSRLETIPAEIRGEIEPPAEAAAWLAKLRGRDGKIHPQTRVHCALLKISQGW